MDYYVDVIVIGSRRNAHSGVQLALFGDRRKPNIAVE